MNMLKNKLSLFLGCVLILIPVFFVFRSVFFGRLNALGDAPYFYAEGLKELVFEPLTWVQRGANFGGVNNFLFLSPVMILYGVFGNNDLAVRILFYIPAILLAGSGSYFLANYLKLSKTSRFFAPLFYVLNTYFILLIDGGQVGVALAYGIFPFLILLGRKLTDKTTLISFYLFLTVSFILAMVDPRVFVVAFLTLLIWQIFDNWKKSWPLIVAGALMIPLNFYWIYPAVKMGIAGVGNSVADLQLSSLLNALFLYSPHFPGNEFGKVVPPPFYFAFVPIALFGWLFFKNKTKNILIYGLLFLFFAFLSKGTTPPIGEIYNFLLNKLPLGFIFRDSSKFFVPLALFGGLMIGETVAAINKRGVAAFMYLFIYLLVLPAIFGRLNFVLSGKTSNGDMEKIHQKLNSESGFFRSAWFPEKNPEGFETFDKPAIDARSLAQVIPISRLNASEDVFNFLNSSKFVDWFKILGIKYLLLSGDPRNLTPTEDEAKDWNEIVSLIEKTEGINKQDWGIGFPVYEIEGTYPRFYSVDRIVAVVGPELASSGLPLVPSVYFEDGKLNHENLEGLKPESAVLFFNGKKQEDLVMSFLKENFVSPANARASEWAVYGPDQYLKAKYELLIRDVEYRDFDFGLGIAFSTKAGEKMTFKFKVKEDGDYVIAKRVQKNDQTGFGWIVEEKSLKKGMFEYEVVNGTGIEVLNTIALIPLKEYQDAQKLGDVFTKHFKVIGKNDLKEMPWREAVAESEGTLKYKFKPQGGGFWLVLSDSYHPLWKVKKGTKYSDSVPLYSAVNAFYFDPAWDGLHIEFLGQRIFRWGIYVSAVSALILGIACLTKLKA